MHQAQPLAGMDSVCHKRDRYLRFVCQLLQASRYFLPPTSAPAHKPSQVRRHCFFCPSQHDFISQRLAIHSSPCSPRLQRFPGPDASGWALEHMPRLALTADPAADWVSFAVRCYQEKMPLHTPLPRFSSPPGDLFSPAI